MGIAARRVPAGYTRGLRGGAPSISISSIIIWASSVAEAMTCLGMIAACLAEEEAPIFDEADCCCAHTGQERCGSSQAGFDDRAVIHIEVEWG